MACLQSNRMRLRKIIFIDVRYFGLIHFGFYWHKAHRFECLLFVCELPYSTQKCLPNFAGPFNIVYYLRNFGCAKWFFNTYCIYQLSWRFVCVLWCTTLSWFLSWIKIFFTLFFHWFLSVSSFLTCAIQCFFLLIRKFFIQTEINTWYTLLILTTFKTLYSSKELKR